MILSPYLETLRSEFVAAAEGGGDEARALADRLTAPLESAARLALLEALSDASAEITGLLAPGSVELRLRGREPEFVVTAPPAPEADAAPTAPVAGLAAEDENAARVTLRLPESMKARIEQAAAAAGISTNAWLIRAAAGALDGPTTQAWQSSKGSHHFTGWVQ